MLEDHELVDQMRRLHLTALTPDDQAILLLRARGWKEDAIAVAVVLAGRTVRERAGRAFGNICSPLGLAHGDPVVAGSWIAIHRDCDQDCLAAGARFLTERQLA